MLPAEIGSVLPPAFMQSHQLLYTQTTVDILAISLLDLSKKSCRTSPVPSALWCALQWAAVIIFMTPLLARALKPKLHSSQSSGFGSPVSLAMPMPPRHGTQLSLL